MNDPDHAPTIFDEIIERLRAVRDEDAPVPFRAIPFALLALDLGEWDAARRLRRLLRGLPFDTPFDRVMASLLDTRIAAQSGPIEASAVPLRRALRQWPLTDVSKDPSGAVSATIREARLHGLGGVDDLDDLDGASTRPPEPDTPRLSDQSMGQASLLLGSMGHQARPVESRDLVRLRLFTAEPELQVGDEQAPLSEPAALAIGALVLARGPIPLDALLTDIEALATKRAGTKLPSWERVITEIRQITNGAIDVAADQDEVTVDLASSVRVDFLQACRFLDSAESETVRLVCELYPPIPLRAFAKWSPLVARFSYRYSSTWAEEAGKVLAHAPHRGLSVNVGGTDAADWLHLRALAAESCLDAIDGGEELQREALRSLDQHAGSDWLDLRFFGTEVVAIGPAIGRLKIHRVPAKLLFILATTRGAAAPEFLADVLWPGVEEAKGRDRLKAQLYRLRHLLAPIGEQLLVTSRAGVSLAALPNVRVDLWEFWGFIHSRDRWRECAAKSLAGRGLCDQQFRYDDDVGPERLRVEAAAASQ